MATTVEQVVEQQRKNIDFQPRKISQFLYGVKQYGKLKQRLDSSPVLPYDFNLFNRGRVQVIKQSVKDFFAFYQIVQADFSDVNAIITAISLVNQIPGHPHIAMFAKCIEYMGTEEQKKQYLPRCYSFEIVGSYAQTEMGHGSDVASLLTTATYNIKSEEFIIQTPTLHSIKFWPGDLGIFSTHALIFAQLIIEDRNYGVQAFIVPVRDENMKLLPGIESGDIGPKLGYTARDNGYMRIRKVAIPRKDLLARFITVNKNGKVKMQGNPKVAYAAMMEIRKMLACATPKIYASAIIIATKYSLFRRQFKNANKQQIKIMDYQLQQQKIICRIAEYFAITLAGNKINYLATSNAKNVIQNSDFSIMQETHVCLSLGKCFFSEIVYDGMEICRKACGGHGFSHYSGFVSLINEYAPHNTQQGQNTVLYLQIAKHLIKNYKGMVVNNKDIKEQSIKYIKDYQRLLQRKCKVSSFDQWTIHELTTILAQSVCYLISVVSQKIVTKEQGMNQLQVFNKIAGINLRDLAIQHSAYYCMYNFKQAVEKQQNWRIKEIVQDLCLLFGTNFLITRGTAAIQGGFITMQQMSSLNDLKQKLLARLRPSLIGIIDGFGIPDKYIRSQLTYGNPYQNFLKLARQCELNHQRLPSADLVLKIKNTLGRANPKL